MNRIIIQISEGTAAATENGVGANWQPIDLVHSRPLEQFLPFVQLSLPKIVQLLPLEQPLPLVQSFPMLHFFPLVQPSPMEQIEPDVQSSPEEQTSPMVQSLPPEQPKPPVQ